MTPPQCRLSVLRARDAPLAVILRRGPSKHTLVVRWNLARNTFDEGQWFAGRIYPERCDLSPDGAWWVYFAAKFKGPTPTYTVLSRPPWLTAHALWPEMGTWGGGGVFTDARTLLLNRFGGGLDSALPHPLPFTVGSLHDAPPSLSPVRELRLGWSSVALPPDDPRTAPRSPSYPRKEPLRLVRSRPRHRGDALEHIIWGYHNDEGPWEIRSYHLTRPAKPGSLPISLEDVEWADWLDDGALVYARRGALYTQRDPFGDGPDAEPRLLIDLAPRTFTRRLAPDDATPAAPKTRGKSR
jgi:hypothetical protein